MLYGQLMHHCVGDISSELRYIVFLRNVISWLIHVAMGWDRLMKVRSFCVIGRILLICFVAAQDYVENAAYCRWVEPTVNFHSVIYNVQFHLVFHSSAPKRNGKWGFYCTSHLTSVTRHVCSLSQQTLHTSVYPDSLYFPVSWSNVYFWTVGLERQ
jgi:hypothetical protein